MDVDEFRSKIAKQYSELFPKESAQLLNEAPLKEVIPLIEQLTADSARENLLRLSPQMAGSVVKALSNQKFIEIFQNLDTQVSARLLSRLSENDLEKKLSLLTTLKTKSIREQLSYPPHVSGYLMDTQIVTFTPENKVDQVLERLRNVGDRKILNVVVTDDEGKLIGKVFIQNVALSPRSTALSELVEPCESVQAMAPSEDAVGLFEGGKIINLPVVDANNTLLGIIRSETLIAAAQKDASEDALTMFGAGAEERALSSPLFAVKKRLPWLQINLVTAFLAASIVGFFEDTIAQVTVLAVFLPVVAGQSGNTGSQALAVTMRGLALREIHSAQWWKVARKEVAVGFINGLAVALTTSIVAYIWASSFGISIIIGSSMVLSMVIAGFSGAIVPIVLKALGQDPAQSSSIVLTTITDIVGFFSFLGLATLLGSALGIF